MKKSLSLLLLFAFSTAVFAGEKKQEGYNFIGTWTAKTEAIYLGSENSTSSNVTWDQPKLLDSQSTLKITGQDGHRFWGMRLRENQKPLPFIAIIDPSESTIVAVDQSGSIRGKIINRNFFSYCYTEVPSRQSNLAYVECTVAQRQPK